ncbi:TonB-dependent receptor [Owenweeksia hongkongensis]|uniref:TonB-dependent receptor n=1 Tax=Owenweeksia hongkongensis TaxID=253245 RepID=UPI003A8DFD6D
MKNIGIILLAFLPLLGYAQISGTVSTFENNKKTPLPGANVFWEGTETGTTTDENGKYIIDRVPESSTLSVSFIGFKAESKVIISRTGTTNFIMLPAESELSEVDVVGRVDATSIDLTSAELTYKIDDKELRKAACCNLSESFETNASVDVAFTDAVTGTRQIEMLGLAGKYALIQRENIPFARGLNANTGLTYIPGPFVQSIQLTKGLSSVLNGYESVTGQINVEFYKPETAPALMFNAFANQGGRMEANVISGVDINDKISTAFLLHGSLNPRINDVNNDGFVDMPTNSQINLNNRWHYKGDNGWEGQIGISAIQSDKLGGQTAYAKSDSPADSLWGFESHGNRIELFGKNGYVFQDEAFRSLGLMYSFSYQDHNGRFGQRKHYGEQKSAYFNSVFQDIIGTTAHKYRAGISLQIDDVTDQLSEINTEGFLYNQKRQEIVPGAYAEYTFEPDVKFTLVAGLRADYNSFYEQAFVTPRLNLRYMPTENTTVRIGGGRGQRSPNVVAENLNLLASSRTMNYSQMDKYIAEIAWNTGASVSQNIPVGEKKIVLNVDAFYTWFENKLVADLDFDPTQAYFINAEGSKSLSVLAQADYEVFKNFDWRLAYKYLNTQDEFINGLAASYLIPTHRAFTNFGYRTENGWKFDLTLNWFGEKRLPDTELSPAEFQQQPYSDDFFTVNAQINKSFKNGLELFVGADNLLNYRQDNPIVNAENPNDAYFDTNFTWAPIFGRNIYAGLYYTLDKKKK